MSISINNNNVNYVRKMIQKKESNIPYYATSCDISNVVGDYDHFPYRRFFRGNYQSDKPIVMEREVSFRPRHDICYKTVNCNKEAPEKPNHCFEVACSTVFPCYPEDKVNNPMMNDLDTNKVCLNLYR
jgi:hypothetical protein